MHAGLRRPPRSTATSSARPGAGLQDRRAQDQGAAREGQGGARRALRHAPLPQRAPRRRRAPAHRSSSRASTNGSPTRKPGRRRTDEEARRDRRVPRWRPRRVRAAGLLEGRDQGRRRSPHHLCSTGAGGNIGLSVGDDAVFLIDDQYAPLTPKDPRGDRGDHARSPVRFVVNTHWHGDHTGGNENLAQGGRASSSRTTTCASA